MKRLLTILTLVAFTAFPAQTQDYVFDFNTECMDAYKKIFELRFKEAQAILKKEKTLHPQNLTPVFFENYIDFLTLFIAEEEALFEEKESNKEIRLNLLQKGDKNSPYYLYTQAEIYMQWAFSRIKYGEYVKAFLEVRKAYNILNDNAARFPDFKPNQKSLGVLHTLLGAIPDKYKFGAKVLGMEGSIPQGMNELAAVISDKNFQFREEALIMYALMQLHLNKNETEAWKIISSAQLQPSINLLHCFAASSVAMYTGRNDEMIRLLSNRPTGTAYFPFPYLDFYLGLAKLHRLDSDADVYFKKYLENYKGKNYIKESYRKLAWFNYLNGNTNMYNYYIQRCLIEGDAITDEDKSALVEAESGKKPHKELLKARLLFDGAYYDRAQAIINGMEVSSLKDPLYVVEYYYRKARILDELGNASSAIAAYLDAIDRGKALPIYYAANSCIKLGNIYEKEKNYTQAAAYYKQALTYGSHEYKNSIEAEAKAGLNRIK